MRGVLCLCGFVFSFVSLLFLVLQHRPVLSGCVPFAVVPCDWVAGLRQLSVPHTIRHSCAHISVTRVYVVNIYHPAKHGQE